MEEILLSFVFKNFEMIFKSPIAYYVPGWSSGRKAGGRALKSSLLGGRKLFTSKKREGVKRFDTGKGSLTRFLNEFN